MKKILTLLFAAFLMSQTFFLSGQTQQYLHFDRVDDYVEIPEGSKFIAGSDQITMAGWFWCDELAYGQGMMAFRNGGTGDGEMYLIQLNNGQVECRLILNGTTFEVVAPAFTVRPEQWQHWAWVYDGAKVTLFVDGVDRGSAAATGTFASNDTPWALGQHISPFNFFFGGRMDEVTLWSKALTGQEIQSMMADELKGDETGLEIYYKFNQGVPGGDNSSITHVVSEVNANNGANGILRNFALTGDASNFLGEVDQGFQAISFPAIPNKLISDPAFDMNAEASSGLPVSYEIVSGPASVSGKTITLDGTAGAVIVRATQPGDNTFDPASEVEVGFNVLDPQANIPQVDIRAPLAGDVVVPNLGPIPLAAISSIDFTDLFSVDDVVFQIDGETISAKAGRNGHYTGWWTPSSYGIYTMQVVSTNNHGASQTESVTFDVVDDTAGNVSVKAGDKVWLDVNIGTQEVDIELPNYVGAFSKIAGDLVITCPTGGCDPWDRISSIHAKGHNGEWYEIIRYITPYGVACNSSIDLTDFMSLLHGKVTFRFVLGTQGNGFEYTLNLEYEKGTPAHPYSSVEKLWTKIYPFGDPANKKPTPTLNVKIQPGAKAGKLKLVSTGHGWGNNNTGNAAEFHDDTHVIRINNEIAFRQHNWYDCNPNPDGCQPQNGTWFHSRAGWCPGAIAQWFDYDMADYLDGNLQMDYVFNPLYTDLCHPNNPNCVSGVTCADCNDGFNPTLHVASHLVSFGDSPMDSPLSSVGEHKSLEFSIYPNPASDFINLVPGEEIKYLDISILNNLGKNIRQFNIDYPAGSIPVSLENLSPGIYFLEMTSDQGKVVEKLIIE